MFRVQFGGVAGTGGQPARRVEGCSPVAAFRWRVADVLLPLRLFRVIEAVLSLVMARPGFHGRSQFLVESWLHRGSTPRSFGNERRGWRWRPAVTRPHGRVPPGRGRRRWACGTTTAEAVRVAELERQVRELRRANEIPTTVGAQVLSLH
jgi:hypothetical protein